MTENDEPRSLLTTMTVFELACPSNSSLEKILDTLAAENWGVQKFHPFQVFDSIYHLYVRYIGSSPLYMWHINKWGEIRSSKS